MDEETLRRLEYITSRVDELQRRKHPIEHKPRRGWNNVAGWAMSACIALVSVGAFIADSIEDHTEFATAALALDISRARAEFATVGGFGVPSLQAPRQIDRDASLTSLGCKCEPKDGSTDVMFCSVANVCSGSELEQCASKHPDWDCGP